MKSIEFDQIKTILKSLSTTIFRHINTIKNTADSAKGLANKNASEKMERTNPTGTGHFAMNWTANSLTPGESSFSCNQGKATGRHAHATNGGWASGTYAHAEASGYANGNNSHAEGSGSKSNGVGSHAEGRDTIAEGSFSHTEGYETIAQYKNQHAQGVLNDPGPRKYIDDRKESLYAFMVGNGYYDENTKPVRKNAHTLDWEGNAWYEGTVECTAIIVKSTTEGSIKRFKITVDDSGTLSAVEITE